MVGAPTHASTGLRLRKVSMRARVEVTSPCGRCRRRIARPEHILRTRELELRKAESSRTAVAAPVLQSKDALGTFPADCQCRSAALSMVASSSSCPTLEKPPNAPTAIPFTSPYSRRRL